MAAKPSRKKPRRTIEKPVAKRVLILSTLAGAIELGRELLPLIFRSKR